MEIIVISSPEKVENEIEIIESLFENGLEKFHLRKPEMDKGAMISFLNRINPINYSKIVLHQHHEIADDFGISRIHFKESEFKKLGFNELEKLKAVGRIISSSIHNLEDVKVLNELDYCFFGPVFNSLSKKNYNSSFIYINTLYNLFKSKNICALGGINCSKINQLKEYGFNSVAILGYIWNNPDLAVENYKEIANYAK